VRMAVIRSPLRYVVPGWRRSLLSTNALRAQACAIPTRVNGYEVLPSSHTGEQRTFIVA
jgi:hypothetical protein